MRASPAIPHFLHFNSDSQMSIYLIRHAQSEFNAAFEPGAPDPMIFDAPLSPLGVRQAIEARAQIGALDITKLIVSPMTRTLQTATLMFENTHPITINALVREQLSHSCDMGQSPGHLAETYPHLDFAHLDDIWWHDGEKNQLGYSIESHELLEQRALQFIDFLVASNTHSTAIVTHGNFIHATTGIQPQNCEIIKFDPASRTSHSITHQ
jgi:broad specificity phosphatase PhoE